MAQIPAWRRLHVPLCCMLAVSGTMPLGAQSDLLSELRAAVGNPRSLTPDRVVALAERALRDADPALRARGPGVAVAWLWASQREPDFRATLPIMAKLRPALYAHFDDADEKVRRAAMMGAAHLDFAEAGEERLSAEMVRRTIGRYAVEPVDLVRAEIVKGFALSENREWDVVAFLRDALDDPSERVRSYAQSGAARVAGEFASVFPKAVGFSSELVPMELAVVAQQSSLIVHGRIEYANTIVVREQHGPDSIECIVTDYRVAVVEVLSNTGEFAGTDFTMRIPGGSVGGDFATDVETRTPGFRRPEPGEEYVLFLRKPSNDWPDDDVFELAMEDESLFEIRADGTIVPRADKEVAKTIARTWPAFRADVADAVRKAAAVRR